MPHSTESNQHTSSVTEQKSEPPQIVTRDRIIRADLRAEKEKIFLFGNNLAERGLGGQAREMRGEENAVGIPTKKAPDNRPASFFTDFETLQNLQQVGRTARRENENILSKYASRATRIQSRNQVLPALQERKEIVATVLGIGSPTQISDKTKTEFFQSVQKEITVSDYQKFAANEKLIAGSRTGIRKEFAEISKFQNEMEKGKTANATEKNHPKINEGVLPLGTTQTFDLAETRKQEDKVAAKDLTENQPLSLKLYENEIARAEKQLIFKSLSAKILAGVSYPESEFNLNLMR